MDKLDRNNITYHFRLFVAGNEPNSALAKTILEEVCRTYLLHNSHLEIIDVFENYNEALNQRIMGVPTLVVSSPRLNTKIVGSLSSVKELVKMLGLTFKKSGHGKR